MSRVRHPPTHIHRHQGISNQDFNSPYLMSLGWSGQSLSRSLQSRTPIKFDFLTRKDFSPVVDVSIDCFRIGCTLVEPLLWGIIRSLIWLRQLIHLPLVLWSILNVDASLVVNLSVDMTNEFSSVNVELHKIKGLVIDREGWVGCSCSSNRWSSYCGSLGEYMLIIDKIYHISHT